MFLLWQLDLTRGLLVPPSLRVSLNQLHTTLHFIHVHPWNVSDVTLNHTEKPASFLSPCSSWELTSERWRSCALGSVPKTLMLWKRLSSQSETGRQRPHETSCFCTLTPCLSLRHHHHLPLSRPAVCPAVATLMTMWMMSRCRAGKFSFTYQKSLLIRVRQSPGTTWKRYAWQDPIISSTFWAASWHHTRHALFIFYTYLKFTVFWEFLFQTKPCLVVYRPFFLCEFKVCNMFLVCKTRF